MLYDDDTSVVFTTVLFCLSDRAPLCVVQAFMKYAFPMVSSRLCEASLVRSQHIDRPSQTPLAGPWSPKPTKGIAQRMGWSGPWPESHDQRIECLKRALQHTLSLSRRGMYQVCWPPRSTIRRAAHEARAPRGSPHRTPGGTKKPAMGTGLTTAPQLQCTSEGPSKYNRNK